MSETTLNHILEIFYILIGLQFYILLIVLYAQLINLKV